MPVQDSGRGIGVETIFLVLMRFGYKDDNHGFLELVLSGLMFLAMTCLFREKFRYLQITIKQADGERTEQFPVFHMQHLPRELALKMQEYMRSENAETNTFHTNHPHDANAPNTKSCLSYYGRTWIMTTTVENGKCPPQDEERKMQTNIWWSMYTVLLTHMCLLLWKLYVPWFNDQALTLSKVEKMEPVAIFLVFLVVYRCFHSPDRMPNVGNVFWLIEMGHLSANLMQGGYSPNIYGAFCPAHVVVIMVALRNWSLFKRIVCACMALGNGFVGPFGIYVAMTYLCYMVGKDEPKREDGLMLGLWKLLWTDYDKIVQGGYLVQFCAVYLLPLFFILEPFIFLCRNAKSSVSAKISAFWTIGKYLVAYKKYGYPGLVQVFFGQLDENLEGIVSSMFGRQNLIV